MSLKSKRLAEFIKELIRKELKEMSSTGGIDGGEGPPKTPYAFRDPEDEEKDDDDLKLSTGMSVVKENYWHYRNDDTMSTKQKLAKSMTEIRNKIVEIEHEILKRYIQLTQNPVYTIREQLVNYYIKLFHNDSNKLTGNLDKLSVVLKISGIWLTNKEHGLTFRFIIVDN